MLPEEAPVELLHWPRNEEQRQTFTRRGVPCLLLVAAGAELPESISINENWVRLPADERDVAARAQDLCRRLARAAAAQPQIDAGMVTHGGRRAQLSATEASALAVLLNANGTVVSREQLAVAVWPGGQPSARSLDALLYRLRRRVAAVNIHVLASRSRGFAVDLGPFRDDEPGAEP